MIVNRTGPRRMYYQEANGNVCDIEASPGHLDLRIENLRRECKARGEAFVLNDSSSVPVTNSQCGPSAPTEGLDLPVMNFDDRARELGFDPQTEVYPEREVGVPNTYDPF